MAKNITLNSEQLALSELTKTLKKALASPKLAVSDVVKMAEEKDMGSTKEVATQIARMSTSSPKRQRSIRTPFVTVAPEQSNTSKTLMAPKGLQFTPAPIPGTETQQRVSRIRDKVSKGLKTEKSNAKFQLNWRVRSYRQPGAFEREIENLNVQGPGRREGNYPTTSLRRPR